jgi:ankyrin repeat protein
MQLAAIAVAAILWGSTGLAADVALQPDDSTPLQWATFNGDVAEAKRLLKAGAAVKATTKYGVNAMQLAADASNTEMIQVLLKAGADPNSPNPDGETALHLVARAGNVEAAKLLLKAGAKVDPREHFGEQTPLMWAAARRHPAMVELLTSKGADVNARSATRDYQRVSTAESRAKFLDRGGFTPLMYAARENCRECVEILVKHKADVDLPDPSSVAPVSIAMMNGNWDIAKLLIEAGTEVNQWDLFGQSPLHVAIGNMSSRGNNNPRDQDSPNKTSGHDVVRMLVDRGANPNQQLYFRAAGRGAFGGIGRGTTPFLMACASGDIEVVKLLLEHRANPKLATSDGQGPIILAVGSRSGGTGNPGPRVAGGPAPAGPGVKADAGPRVNPTVQLIKLLADSGADVNLMSKRHFLQRTRGGSAMHYAVRGGNKDVMAALHDLGIDVNAKDEDGVTALDYAMGRGYVPFLQLAQPPHKDLADLLRGWGATVELAKTPDWPPQGAPIGTVVYDAVIWPVDPVGP